MTPYVSRKLTKKTHTMYNVQDYSVPYNNAVCPVNVRVGILLTYGKGYRIIPLRGEILVC